MPAGSGRSRYLLLAALLALRLVLRLVLRVCALLAVRLSLLSEQLAARPFVDRLSVLPVLLPADFFAVFFMSAILVYPTFRR